MAGDDEPVVEFTLLEPSRPVDRSAEADVLDMLCRIDPDAADCWVLLARSLRRAVAADAAGVVYRIDPTVRDQAGDRLDPRRYLAIEATPVPAEVVAWWQATPGGVELVVPIGITTADGFLWVRVGGADALPTDLAMLRTVRAFAAALWRQHRHDWQNALMLREREHRARNDLQLLISMLERHVRLAEDPGVRATLEDSIAQIHALTRARRLANERLDDVLREYCGAIAGPLERRGIGLELTIEGQDRWLSAAQVRPVVIAVNELITNAAKHGFPAGAGRGTVRIHAIFGPATCRVIVSDDGRPMPAAPDPDDPDRGFGMIRRLLALGGARLTRAEDSKAFVIDIPARSPDHE